MQITYCPTCASSFKVTPDQLELANGWVRCGRCTGVFEALLHLTPPMPFNEASLAEMLAELDLPLPTPPSSVASVATHGLPDANRAPEVKETKDTPDAPDAPDAPNVFGAVAGTKAAPKLAIEPQALLTKGLPPLAVTTEVAVLTPTPTPTPTPTRSLAWLFLSVSLMCLLIAQFAWMGRHLLYAHMPDLRPMLVAGCAPFQCEVTWPRALDSVLIEGSSFSEASSGGYALQLRLRNPLSYPVATPALELTLLDLQDQVVLRRVFTPEELGLEDHVLALRDVPAHVHFDLEAAASQRITGFRALAFYP